MEEERTGTREIADMVVFLVVAQRPGGAAAGPEAGDAASGYRPNFSAHERAADVGAVAVGAAARRSDGRTGEVGGGGAQGIRTSGAGVGELASQFFLHGRSSGTEENDDLGSRRSRSEEKKSGSGVPKSTCLR